MAADDRLVKTGGWMGMILAAFAFFLALTEPREVSCGREIPPVGHLAKNWPGCT